MCLRVRSPRKSYINIAISNGACDSDNDVDFNDDHTVVKNTKTKNAVHDIIHAIIITLWYALIGNIAAYFISYLIGIVVEKYSLIKIPLHQH